MNLIDRSKTSSHILRCYLSYVHGHLDNVKDNHNLFAIHIPKETETTKELEKVTV